MVSTSDFKQSSIFFLTTASFLSEGKLSLIYSQLWCPSTALFAVRTAVLAPGDFRQPNREACSTYMLALRVSSSGDPIGLLCQRIAKARASVFSLVIAEAGLRTHSAIMSAGPVPEKIFVGGLPYSMNEDELKTHFEKFGTVKDSFIVKDFATKESKGYGFIEFEDAETASSAIKGMDGKEIGGRRVTVNHATPGRGGASKGGSRGGRSGMQGGRGGGPSTSPYGPVPPAGGYGAYGGYGSPYGQAGGYGGYGYGPGYGGYGMGYGAMYGPGYGYGYGQAAGTGGYDSGAGYGSSATGGYGSSYGTSGYASPPGTQQSWQ